MSDLCETCGIGYYLPSGKCDHCNTRPVTTDCLVQDSAVSDMRPSTLVDRLRGKYTVPIRDGGGTIDGKDTFTRQFETPPIQHEAADRIRKLEEALRRIVRETDAAMDLYALTNDGRFFIEVIEQVNEKANSAIAGTSPQPPTKGDCDVAKGE